MYIFWTKKERRKKGDVKHSSGVVSRRPIGVYTLQHVSSSGDGREVPYPCLGSYFLMEQKRKNPAFKMHLSEKVDVDPPDGFIDSEGIWYFVLEGVERLIARLRTRLDC